MTGAGTSELAFGKETTFKGSLADEDSDGTDDYWAFGRNQTLQELNLQNQLQRMRDAGAVEAANSLAGNVEGAVGVQAVVSNDVHADVHDVIFNSGGTSFTGGRTASARIFAGIDYLNGTAERELIGCIPTEFSIDWQQGQATTFTLTMMYADEEENASITPSSITKPSDGSEVPHHGADLTVDAGSVQKLQSATLSISNIARYHRGASRVAEDAVIAAPETTLDFSAIIHSTDYLDLAYGGGGADVSSTQDSIESVSGSLSLSAAGTTVATYDLPKIQPDTHGWSDLVSADNDATEDVSAHVNGGVSVA
ncbi:hypothetical protein BRC81_02965 [Halobacteriales archaeon QS_1_68_20]|nr:MAG: hypothetical protein BRC81_02965 [Halobacteriales archaeon QS_1_68_20]